MDQCINHARHSIVAALGLAMGVNWGASAHAQSPAPDAQYLNEVVRLSGVIGKAHAVRVRCNGRDDQYWRGFMQRLLDLEAPEQGALRRSMASAFNQAFSFESSARPFCDDTAVEAEALYAAEGRDLADSLASFHFPKPNRRD